MSFQKLWEKIEKNKSYHEQNDGIKSIRNGIGIKKEFWNDFMLLLNDPESLSDLLDVSLEKISTWREKIKEAIKKVEEEDKEPITKERKTLLKTGMPEEK